MALSLQKLVRLLGSKGLIPKRYFTVGGMCVYIEILAIDNADLFFLYIPSKYDIKTPSGPTTFKISSIEINEDGTIPGDYAGEVDNVELEKSYQEVDVGNTNSSENLEDQLESNYNYPLSLKDINKQDMKELREVFRQLKRLRLCVHSLKYKLCITFKNYLCCIRRDNTFDGFIIREWRGNDERRLIVNLDLESLYDKLNTVSLDVRTVREGVYRVLDRNQVKHTLNLHKILQHKETFTSSSEFISGKKQKYVSYLGRLESMLGKLNTASLSTTDKITLINDQYESETSIKGLHKDIEKSHLIAKQEEELTNISAVKREVIRNILIVKGKIEDLSLKTDKVCFDNIIMLDAILKNFVDMTEF